MRTSVATTVGEQRRAVYDHREWVGVGNGKVDIHIERDRERISAQETRGRMRARGGGRGIEDRRGGVRTRYTKRGKRQKYIPYPAKQPKGGEGRR